MAVINKQKKQSDDAYLAFVDSCWRQLMVAVDVGSTCLEMRDEVQHQATHFASLVVAVV